MPKKQQPHFNISGSKNYVHPSLVARSNASPETRQEASTSVNERIEHLRRTQGLAATSVETQGMYASRHAPTSVPPGRRKVAGPPPPRSWIVGNDGLPSEVNGDNSLPEQSPRLNRLPGVTMPAKASLLDYSLRSMASHFEWHLAFDHAYLSTLPIELKLQLMSYIGVHGRQAVSRDGLEMLFLDPSASGLADSTGSLEVTRLDLTRSIGRSLTLPELQRLWKERSMKRKEEARASILESWEDDLDLNDLSLATPLQFPCLTHLSLAHPTLTVSWQDLINFSYHLGSLTHLCLDFWPRPCLPEMQPVSLQYRSLLDNPVVGARQSQEQEGAIILRLLSRNTPSLQWLSFAGCQVWYDALLPQEDEQAPPAAITRARTRDLESALTGPSRNARLARLDQENMSSATESAGRGPDWNCAWRRVRYVNVSQDWIPLNIKTEDLMKLVIPRKARSANREALKAEPFRLPPMHEAYRLSSESDEVQRVISERLRRNRWVLLERLSICLASTVDRKRSKEKLPTAEFDFGWGRAELLAAGYEEQTVFDAGL